MKGRTFFILLIVLSVGALAFFVFRKDEVQAIAPAAEVITVHESFDEGLCLRVLHEDEIVSMTLHDYLTGVVSAEMPKDFPPEALKAQAIAARTFTLRQADRHKHTDADICTRSDCCQGWQTEPHEQARQAVEQTDGLVVTYEDELIEATYFSCCGNRTENALAVWGSDVPYLQSVESRGEEGAPRYTDTVTVAAADFAEILRMQYPQISLQGAVQGWLGKITYTKGGGIDTATIGGVSVTGTELRRLFSLRSTDITFSFSDDAVTMTTYGFGHRVGLSQYGAKAMAEEACNFEEILTHYYQNVQIRRLYTNF